MSEHHDENIDDLSVVLVWIPVVLLLLSPILFYCFPSVRKVELLIACAGWANLVAVIAIVREFKKIGWKAIGYARALAFTISLLLFLIILAWDLTHILHDNLTAYLVIAGLGLLLVLYAFVRYQAEGSGAAAKESVNATARLKRPYFLLLVLGAPVIIGCVICNALVIAVPVIIVVAYMYIRSGVQGGIAIANEDAGAAGDLQNQYFPPLVLGIFGLLVGFMCVLGVQLGSGIADWVGASVDMLMVVANKACAIAVPDGCDNLADLLISFYKVVEERVHVWIHLIGIPLIYLLVDLVQGRHAETAKEQEKYNRYCLYDSIMLANGLAFAVVGFTVASAIGNENSSDAVRLEDVAAAAILILWNIAYVHLYPNSGESAVCQNGDEGVGRGAMRPDAGSGLRREDTAVIDVDERGEASDHGNQGERQLTKGNDPRDLGQGGEGGDVKVYQSGNWAGWTERLWSKAEPGWLERDGQDHFYRETVVLPALLRAVRSLPTLPGAIVDLGCGDGHSSSLLLAALKKQSVSPSVTLVDRSDKLLSAALRDPELASSRSVRVDLSNRSWSQEIHGLQYPTVYLAIFVLQELPALGDFLDGLNDLMSAGDCLLAVVPAPAYAQGLRSSSRLKLVEEHSGNEDWIWAGEYPISTPDGALALPHFHRTLDDYRRIVTGHGLAVKSREYLCVTNTPDAHRVFANTVYGPEIIGKKSAMLLTFCSAGVAGTGSPRSAS